MIEFSKSPGDTWHVPMPMRHLVDTEHSLQEGSPALEVPFFQAGSVGITDHSFLDFHLPH